MEIRETKDGDVCVLHLVGNFDFADVETFESHIERAVAAGRQRVVVDAGDLTFLASVALGAFVRAQSRVQRDSGSFALADLPRFAVRVMETIGLDRRLSIHASVDEAVARVRGSEPGIAAADD